MTENLLNSTILVGREAGNNRRLHIVLQIKEKSYNALLGEPGSVPESVSRSLPSENIAHCKLEIDGHGVIVCHNLKPRNVTRADDVEIVSKKISTATILTLGREGYKVECNAILKIANKLLEKERKKQNENKEYSLAPLKRVWTDYHDQLFALQKRQKHHGIIKSLYLPGTIVSGGIGALAGYIDLDPSISQPLSTLMYIFSVTLLIYGIYLSISDKSIEERETITDKFQERYVCPNPDCHHFMGNTPYKILIQTTRCPYCKCKFKVD